ncbi:tyrosine-protein phosphatase non-receptor type 9-like [Cydia pomonella]|uniref:tyrosine-protein phosphatase non-receptor type 9-like n=1 Tax=Cydia pomonella TaxID=82600 RepID=UPI002ADDB3BB|nr:tyrosine-protein phosphatase non-receptor type 9-like [Cydia pomonella]
MTTEFPYISAMDFLTRMDDPYCLDLIHEEYNTIELTRRSFAEPDNGAGRSGCSMVAHQFFRCLKTEERYHGASFVDGFDSCNGQRKYICVSNPEEEDCEKFWQLAWRHEVTTIVKASRRAEAESYQYWSSTEGSEIECGGFRVKTLKISEKPRFTLTVLRLSDRADREREIQHYQYTAWHNSFEDDPLVFLSFVCSLNETYTISEKKQRGGKKPGAVMVHCSDGLSCSAVYCILDICVTQFKSTGTLSVANTLQKLRRQKYSCLNRIEDYTFCYQAMHVFVLGEMGWSQRYLNERQST